MYEQKNDDPKAVCLSNFWGVGSIVKTLSIRKLNQGSKFLIPEPQHQKTYFWTRFIYQPGHLRNLIRTLTGHILARQGCKVPSYRQHRIWSDCMNLQTESLLGAHIQKTNFSRCSLILFYIYSHQNILWYSLHVPLCVLPKLRVRSRF